jgi:hypothetical protein
LGASHCIYTHTLYILLHIQCWRTPVVLAALFFDPKYNRSWKGFHLRWPSHTYQWRLSRQLPALPSLPGRCVLISTQSTQFSHCTKREEAKRRTTPGKAGIPQWSEDSAGVHAESMFMPPGVRESLAGNSICPVTGAGNPLQ